MTISAPESTDTLSALEAALPRVHAALERKRLGDALKRAVAVLQPFDAHLTNLNSLTRSSEILSEYVGPYASQIRTVLEEVEEIAEEMQEADSEIELNGLCHDYPALSARLIPRLNQSIGHMADRYVSENIRSLGTLGRLLAKIGEEELGSRLQKLERDAGELRHTPPSRLPPALESIEEQRRARQAELKELAGDPEVDQFLLALSRGESSLKFVTPKVLDWLDQVDARDQFRISSA
jgi:hypothetical protein